MFTRESSEIKTHQFSSGLGCIARKVCQALCFIANRCNDSGRNVPVNPSFGGGCIVYFSLILKVEYDFPTRNIPIFPVIFLSKTGYSWKTNKRKQKPTKKTPHTPNQSVIVFWNVRSFNDQFLAIHMKDTRREGRAQRHQEKGNIQDIEPVREKGLFQCGGNFLPFHLDSYLLQGQQGKAFDHWT